MFYCEINSPVNVLLMSSSTPSHTPTRLMLLAPSHRIPLKTVVYFRPTDVDGEIRAWLKLGWRYFTSLEQFLWQEADMNVGPALTHWSDLKQPDTVAPLTLIHCEIRSASNWAANGWSHFHSMLQHPIYHPQPYSALSTANLLHPGSS